MRSEDCVGRPIEQQLRETTRSRFGLGLGWTPVRTPRALARLFRLVGLALVIWLAVGAAVASAQPAGRLPGRGQRPRQSLVALGQSWLEHVRERLTLAWGCAQRPPPHLRRFAWLMSTQRRPESDRLSAVCPLDTAPATRYREATKSQGRVAPPPACA
jgi:hypothetical protein